MKGRSASIGCLRPNSRPLKKKNIDFPGDLPSIHKTEIHVVEGRSMLKKTQLHSARRTGCMSWKYDDRRLLQGWWRHLCYLFMFLILVAYLVIKTLWNNVFFYFFKSTSVISEFCLSQSESAKKIMLILLIKKINHVHQVGTCSINVSTSQE